MIKVGWLFGRVADRIPAHKRGDTMGFAALNPSYAVVSLICTNERIGGGLSPPILIAIVR